MTTSQRPLADGAIELADIDARVRNVDLALGVINRILFGALVAFCAVLSIFAIAPSGLTNALSPHAGSVLVQQRAAFLLAAIITGITAVFLRHRLMRTWTWAKLPATGKIIATKAGLRIRHDAVLNGEVRIEWPNIKAITLDSGTRHDTRNAWRRFPIPSPRGRVYLYATNGPRRSQFSLLAGRPVAPNVAIILKRPVALSNPNTELTSIVFPPTDNHGSPAMPPGSATHSIGLFLRVSDLRRARKILLPSRKVRSLRAGDVAFNKRNDRWAQAEVTVDLRQNESISV